MPLIGYEQECRCEPEFHHPNGKGTTVACVGLDHYAFRCPDPPASRILAHALYEANKAARYGRHQTVLSATLLNKCPLTLYMEENHDYVEKLLDGRWKLRGTFAHEGILGTVRGGGWLIEQPLSLDVETDDGPVVLYGTPDAYFRPLEALYDLKTQREFAIKKKNESSDEELLGTKLYQVLHPTYEPPADKKGNPILQDGDTFVKDNVLQVNVYRIMLEKFGLPVTRAELQYMDGGLRIRSLPVPLLDEAKMMAYIKSKALLQNRVLTGSIPVSEIPAREWDGFNPTRNSGVWHLVSSELKKRKKAA